MPASLAPERSSRWSVGQSCAAGPPAAEGAARGLHARAGAGARTARAVAPADRDGVGVGVGVERTVVVPEPEVRRPPTLRVTKKGRGLRPSHRQREPVQRLGCARPAVDGASLFCHSGSQHIARRMRQSVVRARTSAERASEGLMNSQSCSRHSHSTRVKVATKQRGLVCVSAN